jgi:hypothetical protein
MGQLNIKKMLFATLLGSLSMFIWGGFSHTVIFVGTGFKRIPNEDKVIAVLKENISEQGLYFFPGKDFKNSNKEQDAVFENKFRTGAVGQLLYRPIGGDVFSAEKLITQFVSNLFTVFIIVIVVSMLTGSYWKKVFIISLLGLLSCLSVSTIYWNWYEYPTSFFIAQILDVVVGFSFVGMVVAKFKLISTKN